MEEVCHNISALITATLHIETPAETELMTQYQRDFEDGNCTQVLGGGNLTEEELYDPEYYSYTYRIVGTLFQGIILLVGLVGNFLVVLVVAKTKSMHSPTNCYLVSLALADIIVLVASVPNELIFYFVIGDKWIWGEWGCAIFSFSQYLGINASSLSLTAFTVERYIAICHPMKAQTMCTVSRAKKIICGVWIFSVIYCIPWLTLTKLVPIPYKGFEDVMKCSFKLSREAYLYYYFVDLMAFYVFPLLLSVVLYGLIARILFASHSVSVKTCVGGKSTNGQLTVDSTKTNAARTQVVKMLVMVVVIFAVLWLPYRGMVVYNSFAAMFQKDIFMDLWFLMLAKTCVYINSAINPILYNAMSVKFRRAFGRTLSCGKANGDSAYGRWAYGRGTHTTYTCASTALPSTSTFTYNAVSTATPPGSRHVAKHGRGGNSGGNGFRNPIQSIPLTQISTATRFTSVDLTPPDSPDAIRPCPMEVEIERLIDPDEVTHL